MPTKKGRSRSSDPLPVDILTTLAELGVEVESIRDNEAWALCPGHLQELGREDNAASWSINLETGQHFCFSCGWSGRYIDLVQMNLGLKGDEDQAKAWIRKHGGVQVISRRLRGESSYTKKKAEEVSEADLVFYDPPPRWALRDRDLGRSSCEAYGVVWDPDRETWIIPIRDPMTDKLLGWQVKGKDIFLNHPKHLEKSKTLFGYHLLRGSKIREAYLEESPLDGVRLHTYNVDGAVSGYGVHVSPFQMDLIVDSVDHLFVCLDNDPAGKAKSKQIWREYRHRTKLHFAYYRHVQGENYKKDHGEMTSEEIAVSLDKAYSSLTYGRRFADR